MISMPRYYRKIIKITAEDSPNVRLALAQIARGETPTDEILVPGVLTYSEYVKRRKHWNEIQQTVSLDGEFYKGREVFLFPPDILFRSIDRDLAIRSLVRRALAMGVDAAEGGDDTCWTITDLLGVIHQLSIKTSDTTDVTGITKGLMKEFHLLPEQVIFDRGGGGKQHADRLRKDGYDVRTIGFGEGATDPHQDRKTSTVKPSVAARVIKSESAYAYKNRRAEMYALTADLFSRPEGFAVNSHYVQLLSQLKVFRKQYDSEGRLYLPPKDKPYPGYTGVTIKSLLGRSPDQADSLVLAVFGMVRKPIKVMAGAI